MQQSKEIADVTIIGAGIIGVTTALELQRKGYSTLLIDRNAPASECSSGNAGIIATYGVTPVSLPGLWKKVPKMLLDPAGPLTIRRQYLFKIMPWLLSFWRAGNHQSATSSAKALEGLVCNSLIDYQTLIKATAAESLIKACPVLCVYESKEKYTNDQYIWDLRKDRGVRWDTVEGGELHDLEPALASSLNFAVLLHNTGFTVNPQRLVQTLFDEYIKRGGNYLQAEVHDILKENSGSLQTTVGALPINKVVIACGAWSGVLAKRIGEPVPLEAERGYNITLSDFEGNAPRHPIMSPGYKVISTPMEHGLRIAGMVEFGGFLPPDYRRSAILREQLSQLFPKIKEGVATSWMGHRPTLPDSLPVISQSTKNQSVFYAFGHQHVGLTSAPMTAKVVAHLIAGTPPPINASPFRINRF